ncbi:hypothetical protein M2650_10410 [Luteimonas sp. SX5]|uniref:Uncharacterized protein n=1 Tax=Luteimonas galliterrae TaxID=2940486 RepID=A0ABT0MJH9_9GAMM|nr:hypothetical protein [Luteimonas galliterrae]
MTFGKLKACLLFVDPKREIAKEKGGLEGIAASGSPVCLASVASTLRFEAIDPNDSLAQIRKSRVTHPLRIKI